MNLALVFLLNIGAIIAALLLTLILAAEGFGILFCLCGIALFTTILVALCKSEVEILEWKRHGNLS